MPWLLRDGEVLAVLEEAGTGTARLRGLLGRDGIEGAMLIQPTRSVHTMFMRFAIDVAFVDRDMVVLRTTTMRPWRVSPPVVKAHGVIEAEAGTFAHWGLVTGDRLEIKG